LSSCCEIQVVIVPFIVNVLAFVPPTIAFVIITVEVVAEEIDASIVLSHFVGIFEVADQIILWLQLIVFFNVVVLRKYRR
jgi:hypothetical protein